MTRVDCELCDEMVQALEALRAEHPIPGLVLADVDADPDLQRRWGLKVPVLLLDGVKVCEYALDRAELLRLLRL